MQVDYQHPSFRGSIGVAVRDITPPIGIYARNWGILPEGMTVKGIHRPFSATAVVFCSAPSDVPLALVSVDGSWFKDPGDERQLIRGPALEALQLPEANLIISYSHTHTGCSLSSGEATRPGGDLIVPYMQHISRQIVEAVREALQNQQPATLTWTYGRCNLACNRDQRDPHGNRLIVGYNVDTPADDTLLVGRITRDDAPATILGTIVNYACHPITLGWTHQLASPDFVGPMRALVEQHTSQAPCMFMQGASGELAPRRQYTPDLEACEKNGRQLGYAVLAALESMLEPGRSLKFSSVAESGAPLGVWQQERYEPSGHLAAEMVQVRLPLKPRGSEAELERQAAAASDPTTRERILRSLRIGRFVGWGDSCQMPAWVWSLGNSRIVAQPNEAYSILQSTLREACPDLAVAVMNVANGWCGYLPPRDFYRHDAYSVWQTPFSAGALEALIDSVQSLSNG